MQIHVVKAGETLGRIALAYGVSETVQGVSLSSRE